MAIDRRVARTRTALYDALVRLIRQNDYDAIRVEDILKEADVGRSTFYAHFTSKDDLLRNSLERLRALLVATRRHDGRGKGCLGAGQWLGRQPYSLEHVFEFTDVQVALAGGRGSAVVHEAVDDVVAEFLREALPSQTAQGVPRELAIRHAVATFNTIVRWWQHGKRDIDAAEADRLFKLLLLEGLPSEWRDTFRRLFKDTAEHAKPGSDNTRD